MTKRLQVLMPDDRYREIRRIARRHGTSVGAWVRQALDEAARREPRSSPERKREAIRRAMRYRFPAPEIGGMVAEIEKGYAEGQDG